MTAIPRPPEAVFYEWAPLAGSRHKLRPANGDTDGKPGSVLAEWADTLARLGVADLFGVADELDHIRNLKHEAREARHHVDPTKAIERDLAAGTLDPADAAAKLTKAVRATETPDERRARVMAFDRAGKQAATAMMRRLHNEGDALVVDVLRPIVSEATLATERAATALEGIQTEHEARRAGVDALTAWYDAAEANDRFGQVHALAARLRKVGILPSAGASTFEHTYRRPDLAFRWRRENAEAVGVRSQAVIDGVRCYLFSVSGPKPTLLDAVRNPSWGVGLWTADEVVEASETWAGPPRDDAGELVRIPWRPKASA